MSKVVCVAGESGSGKTTSMRNLDPKTTLYIDCDKRDFPGKDGDHSTIQKIRITSKQILPRLFSRPYKKWIKSRNGNISKS